MAKLDTVPQTLNATIKDLIPKSKILVVGAGGIGCEVLKNLALSGFEDIEIIDLDTIDVSNLNRQFLFRKEHVGKSKAEVAKESILAYSPDIRIKTYHDSIFNQDYGVNFFKRFNIVLNALDNRAARNHVNRMCLAADVPLIESGTAGYNGQIELIKKGVTQCYECQPKAAQRTFPGCTIRNTPSEPVHCIVWAKHLFNQLFGEEDPDQDVSPDTEDPELQATPNHTQFTETTAGNIKRTSTRQWAQDIDYEPTKLFNKFFNDDIRYLLTMETLWRTRKPPIPLSHALALTKIGAAASTPMDVWSLHTSATIFANTIGRLKAALPERAYLVWDKDDADAMDFVTACANIRSFIFGIEQKSSFATKSIAGNIIPAIATANAIVAGLVVVYAFRALAEEYAKCPAIYLRQKSVHLTAVLAADRAIQTANANCYVCAPQPTVHVHVDLATMTVKEFEVEVLKGALNMVAPDAVLDGRGVVVISSEEGETAANDGRKLSEMGIVDGSVLKVDDFLQNYELTVHVSQVEGGGAFRVVANAEDLKARGGSDGEEVRVVEEDPQEGSSTKKRKLNPIVEDDEEDLVMLDDLLE